MRSPCMIRHMLKSFKPTPFKLGVLAALLLVSLHPRFPFRWIPSAFDEFVMSVDNFIHDTMFVVRGPVPKSARKNLRAVIVDIDEKSLKALGQWPWPRRIMADLVMNLDACNPKAIGFDIVFSEPDRTSFKQILPILRKLSGRNVTIPEDPDLELLNAQERDEEIRAAENRMREALAAVLACPGKLQAKGIALDNDLALARAMSRSRTTVLGFFFQMADDGMRMQEPVMPARTSVMAVCAESGTGGDKAGIDDLRKFISRKLRSPYRAVTNLRIFEDACDYRGGVFNTSTVESGIVRQVPMVWPYNSELFPALSLSMLCTGLGGENIKLFYGQDGVKKVEMPSCPIFTDNVGRLIVNYRGGINTFKYISAVDVLRKKFDVGLIKDRYVLIGTSAGALMDLRATPFDDAYPGVEVHANVIDNILCRDYIRRPENVFQLEWLLMLGLGLLLSAALAWMRPLSGVIFTVLLGCGVVYFGYYLRFVQYLETTTAYPMLVVLVMFMLMNALNYFFEGRQKRHISNAFGRYLSPTLVDQLAANPDLLTLEGEQRELTMLFSDIRGFTSISEKMTAPELGKFLNEYLTPMSDIVMETRGTVDKFMGDAVMAFWGAPLEDEEHAVHAARTALAMMSRLAELNLRWQARGLPVVDIGIGINTGIVSVGNMGSDTRFDYTVMGDNVNLASRLEGLNKQYGTNILISEFTRTTIGDGFCTRLVDLVRVKGKEQPVRVYELIGEGDADPEVRKTVERFEEALEKYRRQEFDKARDIIRSLAAKQPHRLYEVYLSRIEEYLVRPPAADWDGAFTAKEK